MASVKMIEIRDRGTFIAAFAILTTSENPDQNYLLGCAGWGDDGVIFGRLDNGKAATDPYDWGDRTMKTAHIWLTRNASQIVDGMVVDVEFILGETATAKRSERASAP